MITGTICMTILVVVVATAMFVYLLGQKVTEVLDALKESVKTGLAIMNNVVTTQKKPKKETYNSAEWKGKVRALRKQIEDLGLNYILYNDHVISVCLIREPVTSLGGEPAFTFHRGISIASPADNYCRIVGVFYAMERAIRAYKKQKNVTAEFSIQRLTMGLEQSKLYDVLKMSGFYKSVANAKISEEELKKFKDREDRIKAKEPIPERYPIDVVANIHVGN